MDIVVVNRPNKGCNGAVYIGRGGRGVEGSPLANPRRLGDPRPGGGVWTRGETIQLYETDLRGVLDPGRPSAQWWDGRRGAYRILDARERDAIRAEMRRLARIAEAQRLELDCFCSPRACHGDVIRQLIMEGAAGRL